MPKTAIRSKIALMAAVAALLATPAASSAQSGADGYSPSGGGTLDEILQNSPSTDDGGPTVAGDVEASEPTNSGPSVAGEVAESDPGGAAPASAGAPGPEANSESGAGVPVAASTADDADELPFTGMDAGLIALLGAALIGTGFGLRRVVGNRA